MTMNKKLVVCSCSKDLRQLADSRAEQLGMTLQEYIKFAIIMEAFRKPADVSLIVDKADL